MKKQSIVNKQIYFDIWESPIKHAQYLDLEAVFQTTGDIYFFFHARDKKTKYIFLFKGRPPFSI